MDVDMIWIWTWYGYACDMDMDVIWIWMWVWIWMQSTEPQSWPLVIHLLSHLDSVELSWSHPASLGLAWSHLHTHTEAQNQRHIFEFFRSRETVLQVSDYAISVKSHSVS